MGIHNGIHTTDDDHYYYCPNNDCPCHDNYFYDASGNFDYNPRRDDLNNIQYNHINNTSTATCLGASSNHNNGSVNHHNNDI